VLQQLAPRRHRLFVTLSGALCPAVSFTVPEHLKSRQELHLIAQTHAAEALHQEISQVQCATDYRHLALTAAVDITVLTALQHWSQELHCPLACVTPAWSLATQCARAQRAEVCSLLVHERDSVTLLANQTALTLRGGLPSSTVQAISQDWLHQQGLTSEQLLKLGLGLERHTVVLDGPRVWAAHWYMA
jgi:hypothetical protein